MIKVCKSLGFSNNDYLFVIFVLNKKDFYFNRVLLFILKIYLRRSNLLRTIGKVWLT